MVWVLLDRSRITLRTQRQYVSAGACQAFAGAEMLLPHWNAGEAAAPLGRSGRWYELRPGCDDDPCALAPTNIL